MHYPGHNILEIRKLSVQIKFTTSKTEVNI